MAGVSIDGHACLKTMCFTGFDFRDWFAGLGYPMNVTEFYWLQVNIGLGNGLCRQAKSHWVDIDPVLCRQMASPGHNESIVMP